VKHLTLFPTMAILVVASFAPIAPAQTQPAAAAREEDPFLKGTNAFSLYGGYTTPIRFSQAHTYDFVASVGHYFWDDNALSLEAQGYWADQPDGHDDAIIGGIGVLGRWHFLRFDKWSIFLDGGGGVTYADNAFPTQPYMGTHFNFTGKVGLGATYEIQDHVFLTGGARYFHLSNGQIHGRDQNPTYDSIQIWGGLMWTW
jgi:hypothetical protein